MIVSFRIKTFAEMQQKTRPVFEFCKKLGGIFCIDIRYMGGGPWQISRARLLHIPHQSAVIARDSLIAAQSDALCCSHAAEQTPALYPANDRRQEAFCLREYFHRAGDQACITGAGAPLITIGVLLRNLQ